MQRESARIAAKNFLCTGNGKSFVQASVELNITKQGKLNGKNGGMLMISHLKYEEINFLTGKTIDALNEDILNDSICVMPNCGNKSNGKLKLIDAETKFTTELYLCDRCYKMIKDLQYSEIIL
jgi:hypothetical protein